MNKKISMKDRFFQQLNFDFFSSLQNDRSLFAGIFLYISLIVVSVSLFGFFYLRDGTVIYSSNVPLLKDIRLDSSSDYKNFSITDAALSNDGSRLFASRHDAGILEVTSRNFRLLDDVPGPFSDGSYDRSVLDIAVTSDDLLLALGKDRLRVSGKLNREWNEIIGGGKVPGFKRENIKKVASDGDDLIFLLDNRSGWCVYERNIRKLDPVELSPPLDEANNENVEDFEIVSNGSGLLLSSFKSELSDLNGFWIFERDGSVINRKPRQFDTEFGYPKKLIRGDLGLFVLTDKGAVFEIRDLNDSTKDILLVGGSCFSGFNPSEIVWLQPSRDFTFLWCLLSDGLIGKYDLKTRSWRSLDPAESGLSAGIVGNPVVVNEGQELLVATSSGRLNLLSDDNISRTRLILKSENISGFKSIQNMGELPDIDKIWFIAENSRNTSGFIHEELFLTKWISAESLAAQFFEKPGHVWSRFSETADSKPVFKWDRSLHRPLRDQVELISDNGLVYPYSLENRYFGLVKSEYQLPESLLITGIASSGTSDNEVDDLLSLSDGSVWSYSSNGINRRGTISFPTVSDKSEFLRNLDFQLLGIDSEKQFFLRSDGMLTSYDRSSGYSGFLADNAFETPLKLDESNVLMKAKEGRGEYSLLTIPSSETENPVLFNVGQFQEVYQSPSGFGYKKSEYEYGAESLPFGEKRIQRNLTVENDINLIGDRISRCEVISERMVLADEYGILVYDPTNRDYSRPVKSSGEFSWDYVGIWKNKYGLFYSKNESRLYAVNPISSQDQIIFDSVESPVLVNDEIFAIQDGNLLLLDNVLNRRIFPSKDKSVPQLSSYADVDVSGDQVWLLSDTGALIEYHFEAGSKLHSSAPALSEIFTNDKTLVGINENGSLWISILSGTHSDLSWKQINLSNPGFSNQIVREIRKGSRSGSFLIRTDNEALWFLDSSKVPLCIAGGKSNNGTGDIEWVSIDDEGIWFIDSSMQLNRWEIESRSLLPGRHKVNGFISWLPHIRRSQTSVGLWTTNGAYFVNDQFEISTLIDQRIYSFTKIGQNTLGSIEEDYWVNVETGQSVGSRSEAVSGNIKAVNAISPGYVLQLADKIVFHNPRSFGNSVSDIFDIDSPANIFQFGKLDSILQHGNNLFDLTTSNPRKIVSEVRRFDCGNEVGISIFNNRSASLLSDSKRWIPILGERNGSNKSKLFQVVRNQRNNNQAFILGEKGETFLYDSGIHSAIKILDGVSRIHALESGGYAQTGNSKVYELGDKARLVFDSSGIRQVSFDGSISGIDQSVPWAGTLRSQRNDLWDVRMGHWPNRVDRLKIKPGSGNVVSISGFNKDLNQVILTDYDISTGRSNQVRGFEYAAGDQCLRILSSSNGNPYALSTSEKRSGNKFLTFLGERSIQLLNPESGPLQISNEINFIDSTEVWNVKRVLGSELYSFNQEAGVLENKQWRWGLSLGEGFWLHALNDSFLSGYRNTKPVLNSLVSSAWDFAPKYLKKNNSKGCFYFFSNDFQEVLFVNKSGASDFKVIPNRVFGIHENRLLSSSLSEVQAYDISGDLFSFQSKAEVLFQSPQYPSRVAHRFVYDNAEFYLTTTGNLESRKIEIPFDSIQNLFTLPATHESVYVSKVKKDKIEIVYTTSVTEKGESPDIKSGEKLISDISPMLNTDEFMSDFFQNEFNPSYQNNTEHIFFDWLFLRIETKGENSFLILMDEQEVNVPFIQRLMMRNNTDRLLKKWKKDFSKQYVTFKNDYHQRSHLQSIATRFADIELVEFENKLFVLLDKSKSTAESRGAWNNIANGLFGVSVDLKSFEVESLLIFDVNFQKIFSSNKNLKSFKPVFVKDYGAVKDCKVVDSYIVLNIAGFEDYAFFYAGSQKWALSKKDFKSLDAVELSDVLESPKFLRRLFRRNSLDVYGDNDWVLSLKDGRYQRERFNALGEINGECFARSIDGRWWDKKLNEVQRPVGVYRYNYQKESSSGDWSWVHDPVRNSISVSSKDWSAEIENQVVSNGSKPIWDFPTDIISSAGQAYVLCGEYLWFFENGRRQLIQSDVKSGANFGWFESGGSGFSSGINVGNESFLLRGSDLIPTSFQENEVYRYENTDFSLGQLAFSSSKTDQYPNVETTVLLSDGSAKFSAFLGDCFEHEFPDNVEERDGVVFLHCGNRFSLKVDTRGQFEVFDYQGQLADEKAQKVNNSNFPLCSYSLIEDQYFCLFNEGEAGFSGELGLKNGTLSYEFPKFHDSRNGYLIGLVPGGIFYRKISSPEEIEYFRGLPFGLSEIKNFKGDSNLDAWVLTESDSIYKYDRDSDSWNVSVNLGPFSTKDYHCQNLSQRPSIEPVVSGEVIDFRFTGRDFTNDPQFKYLPQEGNFSRFVVRPDSDRQSMYGFNRRNYWYSQDGEVSSRLDQWAPEVEKTGIIPQWPDPIKRTSSTGIGVIKEFSTANREVCWISGTEVRPISGGLHEGLLSIHICEDLARANDLLVVSTNSGLLFSGNASDSIVSKNLRPVLIPEALDLSQVSDSYKHVFAATNLDTVVNIAGLGQYFNLGSGLSWQSVQFEKFSEIEAAYRVNEGRLSHYSWSRGSESYSFNLLIQNAPSVPVAIRKGLFEFDTPVSIRPISAGVLLEIAVDENSRDLLYTDDQFEGLPYRAKETIYTPYTIRNGYRFSDGEQVMSLGIDYGDKYSFLKDGSNPEDFTWVTSGNLDITDEPTFMEFPYEVEKNQTNVKIVWPDGWIGTLTETDPITPLPPIAYLHDIVNDIDLINNGDKYSLAMATRGGVVIRDVSDFSWKDGLLDLGFGSFAKIHSHNNEITFKKTNADSWFTANGEVMENPGAGVVLLAETPHVRFDKTDSEYRVHRIDNVGDLRTAKSSDEKVFPLIWDRINGLISENGHVVRYTENFFEVCEDNLKTTSVGPYNGRLSGEFSQKRRSHTSTNSSLLTSGDLEFHVERSGLVEKKPTVFADRFINLNLGLSGATTSITFDEALEDNVARITGPSKGQGIQVVYQAAGINQSAAFVNSPGDIDGLFWDVVSDHEVHDSKLFLLNNKFVEIGKNGSKSIFSNLPEPELRGGYEFLKVQSIEQVDVSLFLQNASGDFFQFEEGNYEWNPGTPQSYILANWSSGFISRSGNDLVYHDSELGVLEAVSSDTREEIFFKDGFAWDHVVDLEKDYLKSAYPFAQELVNGRYRVLRGDQGRFENPDFWNPARKLKLSFGDYAVESFNAMSHGSYSILINGVEVFMTTKDSLFLKDSKDKLWIVSPESIHWLRLENRWLDRLIRDGVE